MAAAPFVMINGGHSAICEALSLGKPILAEPIKAQYEQILNGVYLEKMGVGLGVRKLSAKQIKTFSERVPLMHQRALHLDIVDNEGMIQKYGALSRSSHPPGYCPDIKKNAVVS